MNFFIRMLIVKKPVLQITGSILLAGVALLVVMVYLPAAASDPAQAQGTVRYVAPAPAGNDAGDCSTLVSPCVTVQYAVDQAQDGDEIRVAKGTYTDVHVRDSITQVVYITKSVTIRGGYTTANWNDSKPVSNKTRLDAQGQGRVIVVSVDYPTRITVTLEGFVLTGGDATGLGPGIYDLGGGLYISNYGTTTISKTVIYSNTASTTRTGWGGGLYAQNGSFNLINSIIQNNQAGVLPSYGGGVYLANPGESELVNNTIQNNIATTGTGGYGGGIYLWHTNDFATVTLDSNTITNNTGSPNGAGSGGGLYLTGDSVAVIQNNTIQENIASGDTPGEGGGVYIDVNPDLSSTIIQNNAIISNTASITGTGEGGGVFLKGSDSVILQNNTIISNTAVLSGGGNTGSYGGGVYMNSSAASLLTNTIQGNVSARNYVGNGGGVALSGSPALLQGNLISGNTASLTDQGKGGGVYVNYVPIGNVTLQNNTIISNTASAADVGYGGGVYAYSSQLSVENNTVQNNVASAAVADSFGGGIYLHGGGASFLRRNRVTSNTANEGGGAYIKYSNPLTLTNNLVAGNRASVSGSGLIIKGSFIVPMTSTLLVHNTVADNTGAGQGLYVSDYVTATLTNTIFAGHTQGVYVESGGVVSLDATLWYNNGTDTDGPGGINIGAVNLSGNPAFVDPSTWDYHLGPGSAAIDVGIDAGVTDDLDGDARPYAGGLPDIGVDEANNRRPIANAGASQTVNPDATVTLDGSASNDPDGGDLSYYWTQTGGPAVSLSSATAVSPTFTAPSSETVLTFSLTVTDSFNLTSTATTAVTVSSNQPPTANAGSPQTVDPGDTVMLDGSASSDPDGDPLTFGWTQTGGTGVTLSSATAVSPTFTAPNTAGVLTFTLTVTDTGNLSDSDVTTVTVANLPPIADAGPDQNVNTLATVTLDGSGSSDPNGDALTYLWQQTGGPTVTLNDPTAVSPTFTAPSAAGVLTFTLTVTDSLGLSSTPDEVTITVTDYLIYLSVIMKP